jgi:hypothetical protein
MDSCFWFFGVVRAFSLEAIEGPGVYQGSPA